MTLEFDAMDPDDPAGTVKVRVAKGDWYTQVCPDCGRENGLWIVGPDSPGEPDKPRPCVSCKGPNVAWIKVEHDP